MRNTARSFFAHAATCCLLLHAPGSAHAVCRIVEPIEERGGVVFDPTTMVLYVLAPQQIVDYRCPEVDAGGMPPPVAGKGGMMMMTPPIDACGFIGFDAGTDDAGFEDDAGCSDVPVMSEPDAAMPLPPLTPEPPPAGACAGDARPQPVRGSVVHMVVQPSVLSTEGRAGLVMPVPARPDIHASNADLFTALGARLQPRVQTTRIEIEDESLGFQCHDVGGGCGDDDDSGDDFDPGDRGSDEGVFFDPDGQDGGLDQVMIGDGLVRFEQALVTADYDVTVLNASTPEALETWLDLNGFAHDREDDAAFAAYVAEGAWFVALDVHPDGERDLAPLVVSFRSDEIPLMHRLQYDSAGGTLVTEAFVMAPSRMEAADGSAQTLYAAPAGFAGEVAGFGLAEGWLTHLRFERRTDERLADSRLRRAPDLEVRPVLERIERVRIPSSRCPSRGGCSDDDGGGDGCVCSTESSRGGFDGSLLPALLACAFIAYRGRRRSR
jgi:Uncharacterized protein conserved in bacteria (DUF2330)